jgi:hypothetical protein
VDRPTPLAQFTLNLQCRRIIRNSLIQLPQAVITTASIEITPNIIFIDLNHLGKILDGLFCLEKFRLPYQNYLSFGSKSRDYARHVYFSNPTSAQQSSPLSLPGNY